MTLRAASGPLRADELLRFAVELAAALPAERLLGAAPSGGDRQYDVVWADDAVNAWLIRWSGAADTGFHDHDVSAAGIVVLQGSILDERLALTGPPLQRRHGPGDSFTMPPCAIHRVRHAGGPPALSVHAYSPPLRRQGVYRVAADGSLEREAVSHTEELRATAWAADLSAPAVVDVMASA
jgi:hypothetical protein